MKELGYKISPEVMLQTNDVDVLYPVYKTNTTSFLFLINSI